MRTGSKFTVLGHAALMMRCKLAFGKITLEIFYEALLVISYSRKHIEFILFGLLRTSVRNKYLTLKNFEQLFSDE